MRDTRKTTMGRRTFLKAAGSLPAAALVAPARSEAQTPTQGAPAKKPNFLVIVADDQCYRTINALNNPEVHTAAFDRLVRRGTSFTRCFHQGSWTGAVCVASRAMLHTGRYVWTCGGGECGYYPLLGEVLQMGGYDTRIVGKWHNGDATALRSFASGKTIGPGFFASTPENGAAYDRPRPGDSWMPWDTRLAGHWTPKELWDIEPPSRQGASIYEKGPGPQKAGPRYQRSEHSCKLYADSAIETLRQTAQQPGRPFFLYCAWNSPHDPCQAPKEIVDMYPIEKTEVPPNFLPRHPFDQGDARVRDEILAPFPRAPYAIQVHRREYYALVTYMDQQLGRILDALDETGQSANTIVVVTSDHGLAVGEHGLMGKQNLYDCSVRMPLIVAGPGIPAGRRIDALVYQHSLFPTLCEWAAIPVPATVQFPALGALLRGERENLFDSIYCAYRGFQRMVSTGRRKLILYPQVKKVQLYDLEKDPWEIKNLAADPAHAATATDLFRQLKAWQQTVNDSMVLDPAVFGIGA